MKTKKEAVVEKEFTLDLGNLGAIAKKNREKPTEERPKKVEAKKAEIKKERPKKVRTVAAPKPKAKTGEQSGGGAGKKVPQEKTDQWEPESPSGGIKHIRVVISAALATDFEDMFKRFVERSETFWQNTHRVNVFVQGVLFLEQRYEKKGNYHKAPEGFVKFISRRGNRPKTEEASRRKTEPVALFFATEEKVYDAYHNLIYSFLLENDDVYNKSYSTSYFFQDFYDLLQANFKSFCIYGKKNS